MSIDLPSRRQLIARAGCGFGALALGSLLGEQRLAAAPPDPLAPKTPPLKARAKAVIWLFMNGGPSHIDTWDYKPDLARHDGQELPGFDKNTGFFAKQVGP